MALRVETQTVLRLGRASWPLQPTHLAVNDHGTFVLLAPHNKQFCALLAAQHNLRLPAKASINQSELYQSLLFARRTAENKYQLDQEAARVQEQSSGLFGNADTERAMVEVGSSPRKTRVVRRTRQLRAQAREEQHLLTVNWKNHTLRVLGPGHTTDVPRVLLEDMPRFFAAASAATLTLEDFEPRPRASFPKGTPACEKVVGIGGGRKARRRTGLRQFAVVHENQAAPAQPVQDAAPAAPEPAQRRKAAKRARHGRNVD